MHTENTIWTDGINFLIASNEYEANQKWREHKNDQYEPFFQGKWKPLPRNKDFTYRAKEDGPFVTKKVGDWARTFCVSRLGLDIHDMISRYELLGG